MKVPGFLYPFAYRIGVHNLISATGENCVFPILIYHRINPDPDPFQIDRISPEEFGLQIDFLSRNYSVLHLEEILSRIREGIPIPRRSIAVTFDDGYADNFRFGYPILKKFGVPATIYLATGVIGTGESLWFDRILDSFRHTALGALESQIGTFRWGDSPEGRKAAAHEVLNRLSTLLDDDRLKTVDEIISTLGPANPPCDRMLRWEEIREMAGNGISFGAHTVTHPLLDKTPSEKTTREVVESRDAIENALQAPIRTFSYPRGKDPDYSVESVRIVRNAGFHGAVTTRFRTNTVQDDPFTLGRFRPWGQGIGPFAIRLALHSRRTGS